MLQTVLGVTLCLCITSLTFVASNCHTDGPGPCQFQNDQNVSTFCDWHPNSNVQLTLAGFGGWYASFSPGTTEASLTSRTTCATRGQILCFKFSYWFEADNVLELSVSIRYDWSEQDDSLIRILASGSRWQEAFIPIKTNNTFSVIFTARKVCEQNEGIYSVGIDNIRYDYTDSCQIQPSLASTPLVSTPTESCNNTNLSSSTTMSSSDITVNTETNITKSNPSVLNSTEPQSTSTITIQHSTSDPSKVGESSNTLAIIIGVVVGVIVIIIVVVVLILLRRKRRHSLKANNAQPTSHRHRQDPATSTQPLDNTHVMAHPQNPTASDISALPLYAVVNKPRKHNKENPPQSPYEIDDKDTEDNTHKASLEHPPQSPYEIDDQDMTQHHTQNGEEHRAEEQGRERDGISSAPRNPGLLMANNGVVYQVPRGDTATTSHDPDEEYNALDFEGKRCVAGNRLAEGDSEYGSGMVYNHLSGVDEDAYNEVDRQRRGEVLGDEYSHI